MTNLQWAYIRLMTLAIFLMCFESEWAQISGIIFGIIAQIYGLRATIEQADEESNQSNNESEKGEQ